MLRACHVCRAVAHSIMSFCNGDFVRVLSVHLRCVSVVRAIVNSFGQVSIGYSVGSGVCVWLYLPRCVLQERFVRLPMLWPM